MRGKQTPLTNKTRRARGNFPVASEVKTYPRFDDLPPGKIRIWVNRLNDIDKADNLNLVYLLLGLLAREKPMTYKQLRNVWTDINPQLDSLDFRKTELNGLLSRLESAYLHNPLHSVSFNLRVWSADANIGDFAFGKNETDADEFFKRVHDEHRGLEEDLTKLLHELAPESNKTMWIKEAFRTK